MKKIFLSCFVIGALLFGSCGSSSSGSGSSKDSQEQSDEQGNSNEDENSRSESVSDKSGIVGVWVLSNLPRGMKSMTLNIKGNGSMVMEGYGYNEDEHMVYSGSWTRNGNKLYLTTPSESEVGVYEILSIDSNSLVLHIEDEPSSEVLYFNRR